MLAADVADDAAAVALLPAAVALLAAAVADARVGMGLMALALMALA